MRQNPRVLHRDHRRSSRSLTRRISPRRLRSSPSLPLNKIGSLGMTTLSRLLFQRVRRDPLFEMHPSNEGRSLSKMTSNCNPPLLLSTTVRLWGRKRKWLLKTSLQQLHALRRTSLRLTPQLPTRTLIATNLLQRIGAQSSRRSRARSRCQCRAQQQTNGRIPKTWSLRRVQRKMDLRILGA